MIPHPARSRRRIASALALASLALATAPGVAAAEDPFDTTVRRDLSFYESQLRRTSASMSSSTYPLYTESSGAWRTTGGTTSWTPGFFPGSLWFAYEATGDAKLRTDAQARQAPIEVQKTLSRGDLGFRLFTAYGNAHRLTGTASYKQVALTAAGTLAARYSSKTGSVRANWPAGGSSDYIVTSDVMPSLGLLFWGARNGGNAAWRDMAIQHALRARANHVRPDGGSYHVVNYSPTTGAVKHRGTAQGAADESTWARGQAWMVYGFTDAFRETKDARFLESANKTADYFMSHLRTDKIPFWDFQAPGIPNAPLDSSASAVVASALLDLARHDTDAGRRAKHAADARELITALSSSEYLANTTPGFAAVLKHGTANVPSDQGIDRGLTYGDYYFGEALLRLRRVAPSTPELGVAAVSAKAVDGTNVASNAVDGNLATRWSANGDGQWLTLDLGAVQPVTKLALAYHQGNVRAGRFDVLLSQDGANFSKVAGAVTSASTLERETYDFADAAARYVRIVGHGNTTSTFNSIAEVDVH